MTAMGTGPEERSSLHRGHCLLPCLGASWHGACVRHLTASLERVGRILDHIERIKKY